MDFPALDFPVLDLLRQIAAGAVGLCLVVVLCIVWLMVQASQAR